MLSILRLIFAVVATVTLATSLALAEHPTEHPSEHPNEHPKAAKKEHPDSKAAGPVSKEALATAIEAHVAEVSAAASAFVVEDEATGTTLRLILDKVHKERLARVGPDTYFACADFTAADGTSYDLDFFMRGSAVDQLSLTDLSVHKKNGHARYGWVMRDGLWTRSPSD
jgi:hypothetical protein